MASTDESRNYPGSVDDKEPQKSSAVKEEQQAEKNVTPVVATEVPEENTGLNKVEQQPKAGRRSRVVDTLTLPVGPVLTLPSIKIIPPSPTRKEDSFDKKNGP